MKRIIQSLLRRLDLHVSRASKFEQLLALEHKFAALFGDRGTESLDSIVARIPVGGEALTPQGFTGLCAAYSALSSSDARQQVSEHCLTLMLAGPLSQLAFLSETTVMALAAHELHRQAVATRAFAEGRLDESATAWKLLCSDVPSVFNLACHGRVLVAGNDLRGAFAVLADAVERYPQSVQLATQLAVFFIRIGDIDAANSALNAPRHTFLDERSALAPQQIELDRAIDEGRIGEAAEAPSTDGDRHPLDSSVTEFQNPLAARQAALRRLTERIIAASKGTVTAFEFGSGKPITDLTAKHMLVSHTTGVERCYPATLAQLYHHCRALHVKHLVVGQAVDFDRDSLRYHALGEFPRVTRLGGGGRFLHDFGKLLDDAGYLIAETMFVPPTLVPRLAESDTGYRLLHATLRD
jgi:hypothetical protein